MRPTPTRPQRPVSDYRVRTARRPKADYSWLDEDWDPATDYPEDPYEFDEAEYREWVEETTDRESGMSIYPDEVAA